MLRRFMVGLIVFLALAFPGLSNAADPFRRLDRRSFEGRSIVGTHHSHPVRHPADLQIYFRTAELTGYGVLTPTLYWKSRCNGHNYILSFVHGRLSAQAPVSTHEPCTGRDRREEHWLKVFFVGDLDWSLTRGRLKLDSGEREIILANTRSLRRRSVHE
jgi:hypothetical protein